MGHVKADAAETVISAWNEHAPLEGERVPNFFEAGGTSLAAASLMSSLSQAFGRAVPIRLLVHNPTLAQLVPAVLAHLETDPNSLEIG